MNYINDFIRYLKVEKNYSNYTITNYEKDISEFIKFYNDILNINESIVKQYLVYLYNRNLSKNTISRKLSSLRSFYNFLIKDNIVIDNYFNEIVNPKKEKKLPIYLTNDKINDMCNIAYEDNFIGKRNKLIIELLYATGVRVGELVNIKLKNIDYNNRTIKILGKGSKERIVIYNKHTKDALEEYLHYKEDIISDYLIISKSGNHLTERMVWNIVDKITRLSGIDTHISPHKLRHSFATEMLNNGADLVSVKELLGHESLSTTSIYTHLTNEQIKKVYENSHPRARR